MRLLDSLVALVEEELLSCQNDDDEKTLRLYLRAMSDLRDAVAAYGTLGHRREAIERLLGHTWLVDAELHERLHAQWQSVVDELRATLSAMTVNERLSEIGLLEEFDDAIRRAHRSDATRCLRAVFLDDANINAILENQGLPADRTGPSGHGRK